jgi:hypothetical protein
MKSRKVIFFSIFLLSLSAVQLLGISFRGIDLSDDNRVLFRADSRSQHTLFISRLTDLALQQLTAFP